MSTNGYINIQYGKRVLTIYNHWDSYLDGLGAELLTLTLDVEIMEKYIKPFMLWYDDFIKKNPNYNPDRIDEKWYDIGAYLFNGMGYYFDDVIAEPNPYQAYSYYWNGFQWLVYDDDFKTWRPLTRAVKRGYISNIQRLDYFVCGYESKRFDDSTAWLDDRQDIKAFYDRQQAYEYPNL